MKTRDEASETRIESRTYLITFCCYGARLHGLEGTVDRQHNVPGTPALPLDEPRLAQETHFQGKPYALVDAMRKVVLTAIRGVCDRRGWELLAAHVRSRHVHVVVTAAERPEKVMNDLKVYASRALSELRYDDRGRKRWSRHGSTRYLWKIEHRVAAIEYVVYGQGKAMAVYDRHGEPPR